MWSPTDAHGRGQSTFPLSLLTQLCGAAATSHAGSEQPRAHLEPAAPQRGLPTAPPSWGTLVPPLSRLPQGLRAGGEGQKLKQHILPAQPPAAQRKSSRSTAPGTSVWKTNTSPHLFSEGWIVYPSGCYLALCYKILYFSFLLFSSALFFFSPGFISRDGLWRYG